MLVRWRDEYATGHDVVDNQHRELFALVNALSDAIVARRGRNMVRPALQRVIEYAGEHFATEERLMRRSCYPDVAGHVAFHRAFQERVEGLSRSFAVGELVLPLTLSQFLLGWLEEHIKKEDQRLVRWLKEGAPAPRHPQDPGQPAQPGPRDPEAAHADPPDAPASRP